jgi:hypothetical protein
VVVVKQSVSAAKNGVVGPRGFGPVPDHVCEKRDGIIPGGCSGLATPYAHAVNMHKVVGLYEKYKNRTIAWKMQGLPQDNT